MKLTFSPNKNNLLLNMSKITQLLKSYAYNPNKPVLTAQPLFVYDAQSKETGLKFTIKLYRRADAQLSSYLQKIKSSGSEYVVKFYDIINDPESNQLLVIQEPAPYGTLANALNKAKRFEEDDALSISKQLINGHIDLLRTSICWSGTSADIDVTQNGVRLSWNNSIVYSQNNINPFPNLIQTISTRTDRTGMLPFPENKMILDLIKVSKENASQMSLHPLLKKKEKVFKKKGKNWLAIRQVKLKGQYGTDLTYTAINREHGLVRVKIFQKGQIDANLIKVYQSKPSFTKIIDHYEEGTNWYTISQYANDGNVQTYVKHLKAANLQLKQNHIEFIFFSLMEPLKFINASSVVSFNMLHIKNIYIENGIPKIGEITPMTNTLKEILQERADVPDFYHKQFKMNPQTKEAKYDTYSLGVLLYKLMYTEYPIFPENSVHIPTSPNYKKSLKDALMLFLNKGGNLTDLENELQVSDDIKNQVKQNQKMLNIKAGKNISIYEQQDVKKQEYHSELSIGEEEERIQRQNSNKTCLQKIWEYLNTRGKDVEGKYRRMHLSNFTFYRKCTTVTTVLTMYFLAFFLFYFIGFFNLISQTRLFFPVLVNISGQNHRFIVPNYKTFQNAIAPLGQITSTSQVTTALGCALDDQGYYYQFVQPSSPHWYIYLMLSLITMVIILVLKAKQSGQFSLIRVAYHYYDQTIDGNNQSRFVISSYVFFQLWYFMSLYAFFYLFNFIFLQQHSPCFGGNNWSSLTSTLFSDRMQFSLKYLLIIMGIFIMGILSFIQINNLYEKIPYNSLCNPIFIYTPIYIGLFILTRIGAYQPFVPSFINNTNDIIGSNYINFIGYFPQVLFVVELGLELLIDLIFYKCADRTIQNFVLNQSIMTEQIKN